MKTPTLVLLGLASLLGSVTLAQAHDRYTPLPGSGGAVLVAVPHPHGNTNYPGSTMGHHVPHRHYPTAYSYSAYPYSGYPAYRQGMVQPVVVQTYQSLSPDGWTTTVTTVPSYTYSSCIGCTIAP